MSDDWLQITIESERPLDVERIMQACGAVSVTLADAADDPLYEPLPGETPVWKISSVSGLFSSDADSDAIIRMVTRELGLVNMPPSEVSMLTDQEWTRVWMESFRPMRFGPRLWICPTTDQVSDADAVVLKLDPGLAFGTGTHPTTAMCLQYLDSNPPCGQVVVDYGCGSGILGIAAALLGAEIVHACDIDRQAMVATRSNALINNVRDRLVDCEPGSSPELDTPADVVLANILANTLVQLSNRLMDLTSTNGTLVLSGILGDQVDTVLAEFSNRCRLQGHLVQGDWHCLVLSRSPDP